jgi:hypothetical protein
MRNWVLVLAGIGGALGCGDNSRSCGDGTTEVSGYCVPLAADGALTCGPGTQLDPLTGTCQIDPASCQNGTVLIDMACVDPTVGTIADLQEGPEPNGLGVIEATAARAGNIVLKQTGAFVIHGTIDPFADGNNDGALDPDVDTYAMSVEQPTLVRVNADGLHGITAGVLVTSPDIPGWNRFGIRLDGDTSTREVFLPKAGTYYISVADTRTLFELAETGTATAAPGGDDGDYYFSIAAEALPAPTGLTSTASGSLAGGAIGFYSASVSNGSHPITLAMPSTFAVASLVVIADTFFAFDDEDSQPARIVTTGLGTTLIVVDLVYDASPSPVAFQLSIQ